MVEPTEGTVADSSLLLMYAREESDFREVVNDSKAQ